MRRRLPAVAKTAARDVLQWRLSRRFAIDPQGPWWGPTSPSCGSATICSTPPGWSWPGTSVSPSVLFVPAAKVWEAEQWGTTRPGWGRLLERRAERPALLGADLVACGSQPVVDQALRMGVPEDRVLLTPTGVDLDLFDEPPDPAPLRQRLDLEGRFVVGWVGSFRRFHAVEQAVEAASTVPGAALLLVGDGPERARIERLARDLGVRAVFTGTVPHDELPAYLAAMDVAVVLAQRGEPFHYSPLKVAEYLAAGLPVVAPASASWPNGSATGSTRRGATPRPGRPGRRPAAARDDPEDRARLGKAAGWPRRPSGRGTTRSGA